VTTGLAQWVMHDLRRTLYSHIQRLSLGYHDRKQTGDLISRLTSDIDAIQGFIASGLLGALINSLTLVGMVVVMFCLSRQFTLIALSVAPLLFAVVFHYTRRIKRASREVRRKEGEMVSVIQEALSSMRVVKAFAREEYEQRRLAEQSRESVRIALQGHAPFAAATQAVYETLKALREGTAPKDLKGLASSDLTARLNRAADVKSRSGDFLGLKT
jgi:subfamily B ATP-binding cassette protein MsbA